MRILFVTPWVPTVLRPRSTGFLRLLSPDNEVRILSLYRTSAERTSAEQLGSPVELIKNRVASSYLRASVAAIRGVSLQTGYADVRGWRNAVLRTIDEWSPDAVHLNVFRSAHLAAVVDPAMTIIDLDEFRSDYYRQLAASARGPRRLVGRYEYPTMRRAEQRLVGQGVQVMVSGSTADPLADAPNVRIVRTPVWKDFRTSRPIDSVDASPSLLFVGRLTYEANVAAISKFLVQCWPAIRARHANLRLRIVGSGPPRSLRALARIAGVELYADVSSVAPFYAAASIAIVPLERATGVQMKLIQALSAGIPTIATPIVAALGEVTDRREVLVASDREEWLDAVGALLQDGDLRTTLSARGTEWYQAHHSPEAVTAQLHTVYNGIGS